jgi:hypothetical protein
MEDLSKLQQEYRELVIVHDIPRRQAWDYCMEHRDEIEGNINKEDLDV